MDTANIDFKYLVQNQKDINKKLKAKKDNVLEYDYKIVSFLIGNEYYGVDIMNVKEILKAKKITRIPNALDFVEGVLNLRGTITPIINLSKMFNLKSKYNADDLKSIIILKVDTLLIGIIVDKINHVIPMRKDDIQPPSPLLGTINYKYLEGVIEIKDNLYVILDTDSIFSNKEKSQKNVFQTNEGLSEDIFLHFCHQVEEFSKVNITKYNSDKIKKLYLDFIKDKDTSTPINIDKVASDLIVNQFYSQYTHRLWDEPYLKKGVNSFKTILKTINKSKLHILNIGCSEGYEAISILLLIKSFFPNIHTKGYVSGNNKIKIFIV